MKKPGKLILVFILCLTAAAAHAQISTPPAEVNAEIINGENGEYRLVLEYNFPEGYHQTFQKDFFKFEVTSPQEVSIGPINYPDAPEEDGIVNFYDTVFIDAELINFNPASDVPVTVKAYWQLCDENGLCLFPENTEITAEADYAPVTGTAPAGSAPVIFFLLLAFAGGLLLNIMPCVLPVLSIKALSLVKQGGEDRRNILKSSFLYTAGVIISMLALASVIIIIKASGEQVGWGFQFQNRAFVLVLLSIIYVFALSLFEVFTISAPVLRTGSPVTRSGGAGSHFFSGVIAVLLATPCTAPFLGTAAGFAFSQPAPVILAVFFMVGLGLAFPFILLGFFPSVVNRLPRPGAWMNTFREIMGFLLIGTAVWLIDVLIYQSPEGYLTHILIYILVLTLAAWLYGKAAGPGAGRPRRIAGSAAAVLLIVLGATLLLPVGNSPAEESTEIRAAGGHYAEWVDFSPGTAYSAIGGDRPVFIAFSAKWCMTCRTNESTVIFTDQVLDFFRDSNAVLIHGDYTNRNPEIDEWMRMFGRAGVPFYAWYPAGSDEAVLLPEIISKKMITELPPAIK